MSVCTGASQARAGVQSSVVVDSNYIKPLLPGALAWLYDYLPYMNGLAIGDVGAFCAVDPPTWTVPSATDLYQFLAGGGVSQGLGVIQFLQDITKAYLWYNLCECASGTPTALTPPSAPAGAPGYNPNPFVSLPSTVPCLISHQCTAECQAGASAKTVFRMGELGQADGSVPNRLPVNTTSYTMAGAISRGTGTALTSITGQVEFYSTYPAAVRSDSFVFTTTPKTITNVVPPGANEYRIITSNVAPSGSYTTTDTLVMDLAFYCNGDVPGSTVNPCCPPDEVASGLLRQLLGLTTILQRQLAPFAYVYGANHTGLTGDGEIAVSGVIGASVDVTTLPSQLGIADGTPQQIFDAGWITFGTTDGWSTSRRIDHDGSLVLPVAAGAFTRIGYTLHPGIVVSIRELVREP